MHEHELELEQGLVYPEGWTNICILQNTQARLQWKTSVIVENGKKAVPAGSHFHLAIICTSVL